MKELPLNATEQPPIPLREALRYGWSLRPFFLPFIPPALGVLGLALVQADLVVGLTSVSQTLLDSFIMKNGNHSSAASIGSSSALLSGWMVRAFTSGGLGMVIAGIITLALLGEVLRLLTGQWRFSIAMRFRRRLQTRLIESLLSASGSDRLKNDLAQSQTMFSNDCGSLGMMLIFGLLGFFEQAVKLCIYVIAMCRFAQGEGWQMAAVLVPAAFAFKLIIMRLFLSWEGRCSSRSNAAMMGSQRSAFTFFPLMARLVYLKGEASVAARTLEAADNAAKENLSYQNVTTLHDSAASLLSILALPLVAIMMLHLKVTPGEVVQGQGLFGAILGMISAMISFPGQFIVYGPGLKRVSDALAIPGPGPRPAALDQIKAIGAITVRAKDLVFAYHADQAPQLNGITFEAPAGAFVCIVGSSGSGKSTLARLLMGEGHPSEGSIEFDGQRVTDWHIWWRRELVAFLPAEVGFLPGGTLKDNLRFGRTHITDSKISETARSCGLDAALASYGDAPLEMPETQLSTGEQRRAGVARLLLGEQPVWILDEPISNLDPSLMREVAHSIRLAAKGRTTFVITHDPEFFESDFNLFLHQGKIAAVGKHDELISKNATYSEIYGRDSKKTAAAMPSVNAAIQAPLPKHSKYVG